MKDLELKVRDLELKVRDLELKVRDLELEVKDLEGFMLYGFAVGLLMYFWHRRKERSYKIGSHKISSHRLKMKFIVFLAFLDFIIMSSFMNIIISSVVTRHHGCCV